MSNAGGPGRRRVGRRVAATLAVVAAVAGFELFVAVGSSDGHPDAVTSSVLARP